MASPQKSGNTVLFVFGGIFVVLQTTLAIMKMSTAESMAGLWAIPITLVAVGILFWAFFGPGTRPQRSRLRVLRERWPEALILAMGSPEGLMSTLRYLGYTGPRMGTLFTVVIHEGRVEFWKGRKEPELRFSIPVERIHRVDFDYGIAGRRIKMACLVLSDTETGEFLVQMLPTFEGWRLHVGMSDPAKVEPVVDRIRTRIEEEQRALARSAEEL